MDLFNKSGNALIRALQEKQNGKGYGAEGSCQAGKFVYAIVYLNVPMKSEPTISISNIQLSNCENATVWKKSRYAFAVRASVIANGEALIAFNWDATI